MQRFTFPGELARVQVPGAAGIHSWPLQVTLPGYLSLKFLEARFFFQVSWLVTSGWGKSSIGWAPAKGPSPEIWQGWQRLQLVRNLFFVAILFWSSDTRLSLSSPVTVFSVGWVKPNQQSICLFSLTLGRLTGAQRSSANMHIIELPPAPLWLSSLILNTTKLNWKEKVSRFVIGRREYWDQASDCHSN